VFAQTDETILEQSPATQALSLARIRLLRKSCDRGGCRTGGFAGVLNARGSR
jgi:hypothetical protein